MSKHTGEIVAVKYFSVAIGFIDEYIEKEAEILQMLHHKNIIRFIALEKVLPFNSRYCIIMEYCNGTDLENVIDANPNGLSVTVFMDVFGSIVSALQYLHDKNIVHRDIKPANIMTTSIGGETIYKLCDFGAAAIMAKDDKRASFHGTFEYSHPDIFVNIFGLKLTKKRNDHAQLLCNNHDLWSIGVTLYETATGRLPFNPKKGRHDTDTMYKMITDKRHGNISAIELPNGKIEWQNKLPSTCELPEELQTKITPFLAGLLNVSFFLFQTLSFTYFIAY